MNGNERCANDTCLIMLVRSPEKGTVKTRLAAALDDESVLSLYDRFVRDLLATLDRGGFNLRISYYPPDAGDVVAEWWGRERRYVAQRGRDLGEQLANAFRDAFMDGFRRVVIIGSDSPDLPKEIVGEAFTALGAADAVLGPADDGGYYLIGFCSERFLKKAFDGVDWGTERVCAQTVEIFAEAGWRVHLLPRWRDIDTLDDLKAFCAIHRFDPEGVSETVDYLRRRFSWAALP